MKRLRILIFAKAPVPGFAKTRLTPALGEIGVERLARRLLVHTLESALAAQVGEVELCMTPAPEDAIWQSIVLPKTVRRVDQGDGDLGVRMARAVRRAIQDGCSVLLIGTDCPALTSARLREAALQMRGRDAVLWPARDGGYALLGIHAYSPMLFRKIDWGTAEVAAATERKLALLGWRTYIGPRLPDIDRPEDLRFLPKSWWDDLALVTLPARNGAGAPVSGL